jgi:hypothetical protein
MRRPATHNSLAVPASIHRASSLSRPASNTAAQIERDRNKSSGIAFNRWRQRLPRLLRVVHVVDSSSSVGKSSLPVAPPPTLKLHPPEVELFRPPPAARPVGARARPRHHPALGPISWPLRSATGSSRGRRLRGRGGAPWAAPPGRPELARAPPLSSCSSASWSQEHQ